MWLGGEVVNGSQDARAGLSAHAKGLEVSAVVFIDFRPVCIRNKTGKKKREKKIAYEPL